MSLNSALYWLARLPSILLQIGWEPPWKWANRYSVADASGRQDRARDEPKPAIAKVQP